VKGLFLAITIALACTAAHAEMPYDQKYVENETAYIKLRTDVGREYDRTMAQCNLDADQYMAEHPIPEGSLEGIKIHTKASRRRYSLCMNAAGWPSPYFEDVVDPIAAFAEEKFRRVQEKWEASGKDVQWLGAYIAEWQARHPKSYP
jgi:hypothetical protein